jgi:hypothetical protein
MKTTFQADNPENGTGFYAFAAVKVENKQQKIK